MSKAKKSPLAKMAADLLTGNLRKPYVLRCRLKIFDGVPGFRGSHSFRERFLRVAPVE